MTHGRVVGVSVFEQSPRLHDTLSAPHDLAQPHRGRALNERLSAVRLRLVGQEDAPRNALELVERRASGGIAQQMMRLVDYHQPERRDV